jgi:hypothetical protein
MTTVDRQPTSQSSLSPTTKVAAGGAAGALTVVVVYVLGLFHLVLPNEVGYALTVLFTFATSYFVRERVPAVRPNATGQA